MKIGIGKVKPGRMQTAELKPAELDAPRPQTPARGIQAGQRESEATRSVLRSRATPAELAALEATIRARLAKEVAVWLRCDNARCGAISFSPENLESSSCVKCNHRKFKEGGHLARMTAEAVAEYQRKMAAQRAEEVRQADAAALAARNKERETAGLPALTMEKFKADRAAIYKGQVESERRLGEVYAANERTRRGKVIR